MSQWVDTRRLRIGMAQLNTTVGDFTGNRRKILKAIKEAGSSGVDLVTFPELAICGYPPEDLLFKSQFIAENLRSLNAEAFKGTKPNAAEENIQARIRGNILMALSNKFGWLVLTTSV